VKSQKPLSRKLPFLSLRSPLFSPQKSVHQTDFYPKSSIFPKKVPPCPEARFFLRTYLFSYPSLFFFLVKVEK